MGVIFDEPRYPGTVPCGGAHSRTLTVCLLAGTERNSSLLQHDICTVQRAVLDKAPGFWKTGAHRIGA